MSKPTCPECGAPMTLYGPPINSYACPDSISCNINRKQSRIKPQSELTIGSMVLQTYAPSLKERMESIGVRLKEIWAILWHGRVNLVMKDTTIIINDDKDE